MIKGLNKNLKFKNIKLKINNMNKFEIKNGNKY